MRAAGATGFRWLWQTLEPRGTFQQRLSAAPQVAGSVGGYVQTSTSAGRSGSLSIRVAATAFDQALAKLRSLGVVGSQTITGQDVTSTYIDLHARLKIAEARRSVLLGLMTKAHSIPQTIQVQNALDQTQTTIEELQGSLNVLNNKMIRSRRACDPLRSPRQDASRLLPQQISDSRRAVQRCLTIRVH